MGCVPGVHPDLLCLVGLCLAVPLIDTTTTTYQGAHVPPRAAAVTDRAHVDPDRLAALCSDAAGFAGLILSTQLISNPLPQFRQCNFKFHRDADGAVI